LALKDGFLTVDEARLASPEELASWGKAAALALPVKASLALHSSALALSEAGVALLLAPNGASMLPSQQGALTLSSALVLAL